jgi:hypothetical protein
MYREDIVAATAYLKVSDVARVDALSDLYRRDRREVLRHLIEVGLQAVVNGAVLPKVMSATEPTRIGHERAGQDHADTPSRMRVVRLY